ncbi:Response regulator containing a CheY-like receiver domain and a GGDEF domain [Magnetospirillum molischianum DSM 120]|uniref:Response regulator containing a CheY-like receiver domain and a GGDEF domain n=1 Tax=Magnetospirillum molischianum DSM 120 TaxID=1150626 RepID=H8FPB0_MAGML|nr:Response regulator containing a CheY-like receiver domain and a GGDEF domain [Magnetospirillum molischianum DSM 120]
MLVCIIRGGEIEFINRAGVRMLGLPSAEAAEGTAFVGFLEDDYRDLAETSGWALLAEEDFLPLRMKRSGAVLFEAEMRVRQLPDEAETFLIEARDISRFVRSAEALREREERLQGVLHSVAEGIVTVDEHGAIIAANPAFGRIFRATPPTLIGQPLGHLLIDPDFEIDDETGEEIETTLPRLPLAPTGRTVEAQGRRTDGSLFPLELSLSELRHGKGRLFTGIVRDISERKENEDRINRLAHHDTLTGLPNRNLLKDRINHALARMRRHGGHVAVLFVDLDRFKPINDNLGHEAGDAVLREVAVRLSLCIRGSDTVSRIGGDEFVVVVEEISRPGEAAMVARKILDVLTPPIVHEGHFCHVGASIGIAVYPLDGTNMEDVCKAADIAMYRVKNTGRNGFCFYSEDIPLEEIDFP